MNKHNLDNNPKYQGRGRVFLMAFVGLILTTITLLWGWNTFAVEILSMDEMKFKHALALELLILVIAIIFYCIWRTLSVKNS